MEELALLGEDPTFLKSLSHVINSHQQINVAEEESGHAGKQASWSEGGDVFKLLFCFMTFKVLSLEMIVFTCC